MEYFKPAAFTLLPFVGSIPGGRITQKNLSSWYDTIEKAAWNPPKWVFGPVWTGLYASMGYSSYLIYRDGGGFQGSAKNALALYGTQLALNWAWSPIFFGKKNLGLAFVDIAALGGCIAGCIVMFKPINKTASQLLYPYMAWVMYASTLNLYAWLKNPNQTKHR